MSGSSAEPVLPPSPDVAPPTFQFTRAAIIWCVVAVVLAVVGWYKTINLLLLLGYVMLALVLVNAWIAWRMSSRIKGRRLTLSPTYPGESVLDCFEVTNTTKQPAIVLIRDSLLDRSTAWMLTPLQPGETRALQGRLPVPGRGVYEVGPLVVDASYPFGVIHVTRTIAPPGEVLVLPAIGRIDRAMFHRWMVRGGSGDLQSRRPNQQMSLGTGDVRGVRPYRTGDSPRDVHWRTSARRGQLLVREYDRADPVALTLVVDPWLPDDSEVAHRHLEWCLSLAASLACSTCDADDSSELTLVVAGHNAVLRTGRATPGLVRQMLEPLGRLTGTKSVEPLGPDILRRLPRRAAKVVISPRASTPVTEAFQRSGSPFVVADALNPPPWFTPPSFLAPAVK